MKYNFRKSGRYAVLCAFVIIAIQFTGCGVGTGDKASSFSFDNDILVDEEWVEEHADDTNIVFIEASSSSTAAYEIQHISGAVPSVNSDLEEENADGVPKALKSPTELSDIVAGFGVDTDSVVLIYTQEDFKFAARLFFVFDYLGFVPKGCIECNTHILNGSISNLSSGILSSGSAPAVSTGNFTVDLAKVPGPDTIQNFDNLKEINFITGREIVNRDILNDDSVVFLDARSKGSFVAGHIPAAVNISSDEEFLLDRKLMKSTGEILLLFDANEIFPSEDITYVVYCDAGFLASTSYVVLRLLSFPNIVMYDYSWNEWGNDPAGLGIFEIER